MDPKWIVDRSHQMAPRGHNIVADYLCNYSMDHCTTWSHVFNDELPTEFNMLMHSDGGSRYDCGSAAWVIEAAFREDDLWKLRPMAIAGTYFDKRVSSFTSEASALYACVAAAKAFILSRPRN